MVRSEQKDDATYRRIARRVEDILEAARDRQCRGQSLALDIDARFRLEERGAVQFQVASAILEEVEGLRQDEVVGELLSLGLAAVLGGMTPEETPAVTATAARREIEDREPDWTRIPPALPPQANGRVLN